MCSLNKPIEILLTTSFNPSHPLAPPALSNVAFNQLGRFPNVTQCSILDALVVAGNGIKVIPDDALSGLKHLRIL